MLARDYPESLIDSSIKKARKVPRKVALFKVRKKSSQNHKVFALKQDPRLPPIPSIGAKHWRAMTSQDQYLKEVFQQPPIIAYRRQNNFRDILVKAKVPPAPTIYPRREIIEMAKCGKNCTACPFIQTGSEVKINQKDTWKIMKKVNCESYNCVYLIICQKCNTKYIGETGRMLKARFSDHRGYINNQVVSVTTGDHFNLPGHSLANMKIQILEQVIFHNEQYMKERESYLINKFNTYYNGLNRQK